MIERTYPAHVHDPVTAPCPFCGVKPGHKVGVKCPRLVAVHHGPDGDVVGVELTDVLEGPATSTVAVRDETPLSERGHVSGGSSVTVTTTEASAPVEDVSKPEAEPTSSEDHK